MANIERMNNKLDLFFIILFMVTVSVIIGLHIVNVVDRKLSNIAINLPPIRPNVVINLQKGEGGAYNMCIQDPASIKGSVDSQKKNN